MLQKNQEISIEITGLTSEGNGVGRVEGQVVFVPYAAVGDLLRVLIVKAAKTYAYGKILQVVRPAPSRQKQDCPVYTRCGGCCYRHIQYEAELQAKEQVVTENLRRIAGLSPEVLPIVPSPQVEGYRNKAQYPIRMERGNLQIGFFAKRSHRVLDGRFCRLQPDFFGEIVQTVHDFILEKGLTVYDETSHKGLLRHLYIRYGQATGQVMVCLVLNGRKLPHHEELIARLKQVCPLTTFVLNVNTQRTNVILGEECQPLLGDGVIYDEICSRRIAISPLSFYQVNRASAENLYRLAGEMGQIQPHEVVVDFYCGTGAIGLSLCSREQPLIGVEIVPAAVENARSNALRNGFERARFLCADAGAAAQQLQQEGITPDVVLLDPPRKGCDDTLIQTVAAMGPNRIVMISCNSATAARDCARFQALGYQCIKAQPVDLFPRTSHVECILLLVRQSTPSNLCVPDFAG